VNPLGGCLPLLLQFPILIAMYAVIRMPTLEPVEGTPQTYRVMNNHLPEDSELFKDVITHTNTGILIVNLQCSAQQGGSEAQLKDSAGQDVQNGWALEDGQGNPLPYTSIGTLDCGDGPIDKVPYFLLLLIMIGTTFYQQRQMQKASPPNAASSQQQAIMKFMPLMFGVFGFTFPAGLVLYWMVSNVFQIGQQAFLLRAGHIGPDALDRRIAEQKEKAASQGDQPAKKGFMAGMMERAEQARQQQDGGKGGKGAAPKKGSGGSSSPKPKGGPRKPPPKNQRPKPDKPGGTDGS
jgi:YidC/Oxa1 family membrane protein insertase